MPITHQCTSCRHTFHVPDEQGGKLLKCPACKEPNRVSAVKSPSSGGGDRVRRAAPLRRAQSLDVPKPEVGKPAATDTPVRRPAQVAASAVAAAPAVPPVAGPAAATQPDVGFVAVSTEPQHGTPRGTEQHGPRRRAPRKSSVPVWLWIIIGVMGLGAVGGGAAMVLSGSDDPPVVSRKVDAKEKEEAPPETKAEMLARCRLATVTIHVWRANGEGGVGTGFIIDQEQGWVVTNHHVIENATSARATFETGYTSIFSGIVVSQRRCDLAILKLPDIPIAISPLSSESSDQPEVDDRVYAIGAPSDLGWTTTRGEITRLLETADMSDRYRAEFRRHLRDQGNIDWVQHTAKTSRGNSGGPLINKRGEVIGINTIVFSTAEMGFSVSVKHLHELIDTVPAELSKRFGPGEIPAEVPPKEDAKPDFDPAPRVDPGPDVQPKPKTKPNPGRVGISPQKIRQLAEVGAARNWSPDSDAQYAELQKLAQMITAAQLARNNAQISEQARAAIEQASRKVLEQLSEFAFEASDEQINAVNQFATTNINSPGVGAFFYAKVVQQHPEKVAGKPVVILKMIGVERFVIIPVTKQFDEVKVDSRWLVLGVRAPVNLTINSRGQQKDTYLVETKQLLHLKKL